LVVGAGGYAEAEAVDRLTGGRRGDGASGFADLIADHEAVEVLGVRLEAGNVDVDAMGEVGVGDGETGLDNVRERFVAGDFPPDVVGNGIHAAAIDRGGGEAGPEDDAVRQWIAGGDAELEGIGAEGGGRFSAEVNEIEEHT